MPETCAILLVGHGTRDERGVAEFLNLSNRLAARFPSVPVAPCFLEIAEPTIDAAIATLVEQGARQLVVAPVLLFAAGHAKRDIPTAVSSAVRNAQPSDGSVSWRQANVIECHVKLLDLAGERLRQALVDCDSSSNPRPLQAKSSENGDASANRPDPRELCLEEHDDLCLVVVGRGSYDGEATAAMRRFAARLAEKSGIRNYEVAFIAMAEPKYPCVLREVATKTFSRVVVQPHLLFEGELLAKLRADVCEIRRHYPQVSWRLAAHLGPADLLVDALEALCRETLAELVTASGTK
jgi:sirohydrochlorin cobaltochelatase